METVTKYFTRAYITFFEALDRNNNREWFLSNKAHYEAYVDEPFYHLIEDMMKTIKTEDPSIKIKASEVIFRIHNDMRFSKGGKPYKLYKSVLISSKGRKHREEPGFYLEIGSEYIKISLGCFKLTPSQIKQIEQNISKINEVVQNTHFKRTFGGLITSKNSMVFQTLIPAHIIDNEGLNELLLTYWRMSKPVTDTFKKILNN
ncbi:TIGR02453 family protein [Aestuariivivens sp. NBU2969]|uniref:TIGR02453 family protein n=1 Tax=Aestuariivivens sp. NBU2969 TaxID=2873267 RepID=UPI001CBEFB21|nr:TIGR02453 family protein [Aestuariivivens sp. NBU2969]